MNDVRKMIYGTIIGFFLMLGAWFSIVYISSCGFTFTCNRGDLLVERTPIPTLIPASHSESQMETGVAEFDKCQVSASKLVGEWVSAQYPEVDVFTFTDTQGRTCEGNYSEDVLPLFVENSVWAPASLGCVSCHNADLSIRSAGLDMTSYASLQMGSQRADAGSMGNDIFGSGNWEKSLLYEILVNQGLTPNGHSADVPGGDPVIFAGSVVPETEATPTP